MTVSKMMSPGQKPRVDFQGKASTCVSHGMAKALTGGLHYGRYGTTLDVSQDGVVSALIQVRKNVGACWPEEFDQKSILAYDRTSFEYYTISIKVDECTFLELQQNWKQASFVVVYKSSQGPHCIYVNKVENGKLCCLNSHGNTDGFPQLKPEVTAIYQVSASVKKAPEKSQPKPTSPKLRRTSTISVTQQTEVESEMARLRQENMEQKRKIEDLEMLAKMDNENEKLEKTKNFWRNPKSWCKALKEKAAKKWNERKEH